ncbi:hypothetical protein JTE90_019702 [Oedothorax gibbosus]|uniref:Spaetzle domain-containing protein n=1 Tax=Oedothorax gibbosus TaxID=931172 RepID=A0AAV6U3H5_9ARAC|nr:hypothetical protein JTE90_019702 [Oedothorax gibbosus]
MVINFVCLQLMSLLVTCVYCRALGARRTGWKPGHKKHRINADLVPWDLISTRKRDQPHPAPLVDECCPSVTEIIQPQGGVSKGGRIFELYRDHNSTQSFYQTSCTQGTKGRPCRYVRADSVCVQRYTYTYALVREFDSNAQWRLDYIRIRSGCTCEISVPPEWHGGKRKRLQVRGRQGH